jgi:hypothetical protein
MSIYVIVFFTRNLYQNNLWKMAFYGQGKGQKKYQQIQAQENYSANPSFELDKILPRYKGARARTPFASIYIVALLDTITVIIPVIITPKIIKTAPSGSMIFQNKPSFFLLIRKTIDITTAITRSPAGMKEPNFVRKFINLSLSLWITAISIPTIQLSFYILFDMFSWADIFDVFSPY